MRIHRDTRLRRLAACGVVATVGLLAPVTAMAPAGAAPATTPGVAFDAAADFGSLYNIERIVGAPALWAQGYTGKGVDVALIDTGVSPVAGLDSAGKVINGPDFSFDAGNPELTALDSYGHGTHMAGIIAGRDGEASSNPAAYDDPARFVGVAPDARIVNVKTGATDGAVDVSQVIAAIEWTVANRRAGGMDIGVINLSFGTDAVQPALVDPLSFAVDQAWRAGIVVVVAAGNDGLAAPQVSNPATNQTILAVGASDPNGTTAISDDTIPEFASHGNVVRSVDVVVPGAHVLSLRVPGSLADQENPGSVVADRFIRGSGTSQSAAVVSGMAALLRQKYPNATPDQIKAYLTSTARPMGPTSWLGIPIIGNPINRYWAGNGVATVAPAAARNKLAPAMQLTLPATGLGSLELARGTAHILGSGLQTLTGEVDIFGDPWVPGFLGNRWSGNRWSGEDWTGNRWSDGTWTGNRWSGNRWSGGEWEGNRWSGNRWSGNRWSSGSWS